MSGELGRKSFVCEWEKCVCACVFEHEWLCIRERKSGRQKLCLSILLQALFPRLVHFFEFQFSNFFASCKTFWTNRADFFFAIVTFFILFDFSCIRGKKYHRYFHPFYRLMKSLNNFHILWKRLNPKQNYTCLHSSYYADLEA